MKGNQDITGINFNFFVNKEPPTLQLRKIAVSDNILPLINKNNFNRTASNH